VPRAEVLIGKGRRTFVSYIDRTREYCGAQGARSRSHGRATPRSRSRHSRSRAPYGRTTGPRASLDHPKPRARNVWYSGVTSSLSASNTEPPAPPDDLTLKLAADPLALRIADLAAAGEPPNHLSAAHRIEYALLAATAPLTVRELRAICRIRSETLCAAVFVNATPSNFEIALTRSGSAAHQPFGL